MAIVAETLGFIEARVIIDNLTKQNRDLKIKLTQAEHEAGYNKAIASQYATMYFTIINERRKKILDLSIVDKAKSYPQEKIS